MKKLYSILLIIVGLYMPTILFAQQYTPFDLSQYKRFRAIDNSSDNEYFFYPIQAIQTEESATVFPHMSSYTNYADITGQYCQGWGNPFVPLADTSWLGRSFEWNNMTNTLELENRWNETLSFTFDIPVGDSSVFYQSDNTVYYFRYDELASENILNSPSNIKKYSIHKYDDLGNPLSSNLNGFEIKLSEDLGLVTFINTRDFPNTESGLELMGMRNPDLGYYQLTYDELFPWQPGDTLQYIGNNSGPFGSFNVQSNKIYTIESRVETTDSVWIYLNLSEQIEVFPENFVGSAYNIFYPNPIVFKKGSSFKNWPNHMTDYNGYTYTFDSLENCDQMAKRFRQTGEFVNYCDSCFCFSPFDGFGSFYAFETHIEGLGQTYQSLLYYGSFNQGSQFAQLQYSNVGGTACGTFIPLGIDEYNVQVSIGPNPVNDLLEVRSDRTIDRISVFTSHGELVFTEKINAFNRQIPFQQAHSGIYFARILFAGGIEKVFKVVKE